MAGGNGLWQRLPTLSKFGLVFSIVNICFLLVSLGLTSWSVSGYRFFIDFFEQRSSSSTSFPTSFFTDSDITSATTGIFSSDDFSISSTSSSSSGSSRSYSTFTSTYTSTRTSYTTDPASYTSTNLRTLSLLGTPYRTFTYYYGGERSAYTTVTSTGERLVRTQLQKRDLHYETSAAAAEPSPSVRSSTAWPVPAASPTSAPACKPVAEAPRLPLLSDDRQMRLALPRTMRLHRRQSSSVLSTIDDYLRAARVLLALNAVILAAVVIQLLLCIAYIVVLCIGHKTHRTDHKLLRGSTRAIYMSIIVPSLLIFILAIVVVAYGSKTLGQTGSFVALHIVFWLVCALLGFILAINAYKLSRQSFHHLSASRDSTIETLETTEQQENGPFIFAFNRDQQQADREAHDPPQRPSQSQPLAQASAVERPPQARDEAAAAAAATAADPSQDHHSASASSAPPFSVPESQQQSSSTSQPSTARQYSLQDYSLHTHTHEHYHAGSLADGRQSKDVPAPPPYSDSENRCSHCAGAA